MQNLTYIGLNLAQLQLSLDGYSFGMYVYMYVCIYVCRERQAIIVNNPNLFCSGSGSDWGSGCGSGWVVQQINADNLA